MIDVYTALHALGWAVVSFAGIIIFITLVNK